MINKTKKSAAYIDHSFHKKTKASEFVKKLLSEEYALTELWDESWKGGKGISVDYLNKNNFHTIFFFQNLPPCKYLKKLNCKRIVWYPMWDSEVNRSYSEWLRYLPFNIKIVSFSKILFNKLSKMGFDSIYLQYYMNPNSLNENHLIKDNDINIFFWNRVNKINWQTVKRLIGNNKINKVIFRNNPDPGYKILLPSEKDIEKYNIKIIKGWIEKDKYKKLLSECNVFIAPRPYEGIGMSFLEALALGMCVIAPNNATMNEYIILGENGYLYDLRNSKEIDLSNFVEIRKNARRMAINGFKKWEQEKYKMLEFIKFP